MKSFVLLCCLLDIENLTKAQPSDAMTHLTSIGQGMDKLFKEIEAQQETTMLKMNSMAHLIDFKTKAKTPALVKQGT